MQCLDKTRPNKHVKIDYIHMDRCKKTDTSGIIADSRHPIGPQVAAGQNWSAEAAGLGGRRVEREAGALVGRRPLSSATDVPLLYHFTVSSFTILPRSVPVTVD